jgi:hypothetical protein
VRRIEIANVGAMTTFTVDGDRMSGTFRRGDRGTLDPLPPRSGGRGGVVVTARGAESVPNAATVSSRAGCRATARETTATGKPRTISVAAPGRPARQIGEAFGAGLAGLPIP